MDNFEIAFLYLNAVCHASDWVIMIKIIGDMKSVITVSGGNTRKYQPEAVSTKPSLRGRAMVRAGSILSVFNIANI